VDGPQEGIEESLSVAGFIGAEGGAEHAGCGALAVTAVSCANRTLANLNWL
jgi:hypothetical protein